MLPSRCYLLVLLTRTIDDLRPLCRVSSWWLHISSYLCESGSIRDACS
jgi:hypothetical protein